MGEYELIAVCYFGLAAAFMSFILISMLYKMYCQHFLVKLHTKLIKFFRFAYIACVILSIICSSVDCYHGVQAFYDNEPMLSDNYEYTKFVSDFCYFFISNLLNGILFGRVYLTFRDTMFSLKKSLIILFCIFISIGIISCCIYCSLFFIFYHKQSKQDKYGFYLVLIIILFEFIVSVYLLFLFNSKLRQLVANTAKIEKGSVCYSAPIKNICNEKEKEIKTEINVQTPQRHYIKTSKTRQSLSSGSYNSGNGITCANEYQSLSSNLQRNNSSLVDSTTIIVKHIQQSGSLLSPKALYKLNENDNDINEKQDIKQHIAKFKKRNNVDGSGTTGSITDSLIFGRRLIEDTTGNKGNPKPSVKWDNHQIKLLKVITRHTVLSGTAIMFNQLYYIINIISLKPHIENSIYWSQIVYASRSCGLCGITICLYLSMKFNKVLYQSLCHLCHYGCYKICVKLTKHTASAIAAEQIL